MNNESKLNKLIKKSAYIIIIVLIATVVALIIFKYQIEGEQNMPFKVSSIVISNAEGYQSKENKDYKWDVEIYQNNDVYLNVEKDKNYKKTEAIKSIVIDNIQINQKPQIGTIELYRPSEENLQVYDYKQNYQIKDSVQYIGDVESDIKNLKISNQGSTLIFRIVNKTGKRYTSNEDEFEHNGKLLNKAGISYEEIKSKVSFDLTINLESDISFKAKIELELPVGDITKEGSSSIETNDMNKIVFKRNE